MGPSVRAVRLTGRTPSMSAVTEAERGVAALHLGARIALAIAILVFVGVAYQTDAAAPDLASRAFAVGVALAVAAGIQALASRRARRDVAATIGTVAEFFALALAVALFTRYNPFVPAVLLWPIGFGAVTLRRAYLLYLAAMGMAIVVEINVLRPAATLQDIVGALAWGVLYFAAASLSGAMGAQYRVFQRRTESAYASIATITAATSYPELARMLFAYAERALDLPQNATAALLFDDRGIGTFNAIDVNGIDPEQRARFRMSGAAIEALRGLAGSEGAFVAG